MNSLLRATGQKSKIRRGGAQASKPESAPEQGFGLFTDKGLKALLNPANSHVHKPEFSRQPLIPTQTNLSRFLGRGCDEALFSAEKGFFSEKGGGNSVNEGFGKDFYKKGNSVKRSGPFIQ